MAAIAEFHGLQFVDLTELDIPPAVIELVPESVARENVVLPLSLEGNVLKIIMADPTDYDTIQKLQFILNKDIQPVLAVQEQIIEAINRHYGQTETESVDSMLAEFTDTAIDFTETEATSGAWPATTTRDAPVVKLCNLIIQEADQPAGSATSTSSRSPTASASATASTASWSSATARRAGCSPRCSPVSRSWASIDIAEKRRPQDGRIKMTVQGKHFDLRVSMLPTIHGQSVVMRILDRGNIQVSASRTSASARTTTSSFQQIIKRPNGIFLVTGPTGSGKTTTLYAALNELNRPDRKIITAEDPVEYYLPGINQVEVKHQIGLDFARIIRAMLRQAPNIILVGEIRDKETAEIAVQASLTGHLVFSTLHTNDAPSAITRLADIGVQPFLIAVSRHRHHGPASGARDCPKCKEPYKPPAHEIKAAGITPEQAGEGQLHEGPRL